MTTAVVWYSIGTHEAQATDARAADGVVTLVTGDRVGLGAATNGLRVAGAPGRENTRFLRHRTDDGEYVIPADAVALIADGKLDRQLFNVTKLAAHPHPATRANVRAIVRYADDTTLPGGTADERTISPIAHMTAISAAPERASALWTRLSADLTAGRARKVWLDGAMRPLLDHTTGQVGAPTAWAAGLTGKGVTVAVLDTGYDATHPDLDNVVETKSFIAGEPADRDVQYHGTHVASIVAGSGAADNGRYRGVAPDARLMIGKICTDVVPVEEVCPASATIEGMNWAAERGAQIVNISSGEYGTTEYTATEEAADALTARTGTLFVAAAGNSAQQAVVSPASADAALAVGSVDKANRLSEFSTPGPRLRDQAVKPDLVAPGENVMAARSSSPGPGPAYTTMSGTSMSSPHVAGAAALIAQAHPDWKAAEIKGALMASAIRVDTPFRAGAGRLDLARAIDQTLFAVPPSVSFGGLPFPQSEKDTRTKTVSLRNTGDKPLSLALSLADQTPSAVFEVPSRVEVPARGSVEVTVTARSPSTAGTGDFSATLVAEGNGARARIPVGIVREIERTEHTISLLDRDGKPSTGFVVLTPAPGTAGVSTALQVAGKDATTTLPRGRWTVLAQFQSNAADRTSPTVLAALPDVDSAAHRTITFDARKAQQVTMTVPDPQARVLDRTTSVAAGEWTLSGGDYVIPTAGDGARDFEYLTKAVFADDDGVYRTARAVPGAIPADPGYRPAESAFATVTSTFGPAGRDEPMAEAWGEYTPKHQDLEGGGYPFDVPASRTRTTRFASDGPVRWAGTLANIGVGAVQNDEPRTLVAGQRYEQQWHRPMLTHAMPQWAWDNLKPVRRTGDRFFLYPAGWWSGSAPGHWGTVALAEAGAEIYENGVKIGQATSVDRVSFVVASKPADYRIVITSAPAKPFVSGARSTVEWTFASAPKATLEKTPLPVSIVHLTPPLDADGTAGPGPISVPFEVQGAPGDIAGITVEVSFDGGATWTGARVDRAGRTGTAAFSAPPVKGATVAFRTRLNRADGGTTSYTQLGAYTLK